MSEVETVIKISPSLLSCDFTCMGEESDAMKTAGADMLHLDIMDGHFVPNITFGPPVVAALRKTSTLPFDVHLMITNPFDYIDAFAKAGASIITFHVESDSDINETISKIKANGIGCGLVLKPETPVSGLEKYLPDLNMVLVMTVEPGFGGQKFMPDMLRKIERIRSLAPDLDIEVDGGIDATTAPLVVNAGANVLVAGSALFSQPDYRLAIEKLRRAAAANRCT